ncbi:MAG: transglycosylase SLT domain-containing protein, partial [Pseudomonadota bacterium]
LQFYQAQTSVVQQCHYLTAKLAQGKTNGVIEAALKLWTVGKSQSKACDPAFDYLYAKNAISPDTRWQRIFLSLQNGRFGLADYIAKSLKKDTRTQRISLWRKMHRNPEKELQNYQDFRSQIGLALFKYGLKRLTRQDSIKAYPLWQKYKNKLSKADNQELLRKIGLWGADQAHPEAESWLAQLDIKKMDEQVRHTRLELALARQNWESVIKLVNSLPVADRGALVWQYWLARALEATGKTNQSQALFRKLAQEERGYYGFLAADRMKLPYHFQHKPLTVNKNRLQALINDQRMQRARELFALDLTYFARLEWMAAVKKFDSVGLHAAAQLAHDWDWHERTIITLGKAKAYDDLNLRFPTPYAQWVGQYSQDQALNHTWVYAVMRQESAFNPGARSSANARGLMQLLPETARNVSRKAKIPLKNTAELYEPEINIRLGTAYLKQLLDKFNGNKLVATASYNAGPGRGTRWAETFNCLPVDIWIEVIPFEQTRDYVQRVMSYAAIFDHQLGNRSSAKMRLDPVCEPTGNA